MKLSIMSNVYTLSSTLTVEDILLLKKYNPDALKLKDSDGNMKFAIDYCEGKPSVTPFGITFGSELLSTGNATVVGEIPNGLNNADLAKGFVVDKLGCVVDYIQTLESSIPEEAKAIRDKRIALINNITVA